MTSKLQKMILTILIDKYESRKDYGLKEKSNRRTMLHITQEQFPDYYHVSDSSFRRSFNLDARDLEKRGFLEIVWDPYNQDDMISKLILLEGKLVDAYDELQRIQRINKYQNAKQWIAPYLKQAPPSLQSFYESIMKRLNELDSMPFIIDLDSEKDTKDSLYGLHQMILNQEEVPRRVWSIRLYQDSKRWETLEKRILAIIRQYVSSDLVEEMTDHNLLSEFGILSNPQLVHLSGKVILDKEGERLDLSLFTPDIGINPTFFSQCEIVGINTEVILTIENLTSYYDYLTYKKQKKLNQTVVYLGGYHNSGRRFILQQMYDFIKRKSLNIPFYHWGDMDLGGIQIWHHLKEKTGIPIQHHFMNETIFLKHLSDGKTIPNRTYRNRLKKLLENDGYNTFHSLIKVMLEHNRIVEQEAVQLFTNLQ